MKKHYSLASKGIKLAIAVYILLVIGEVAQGGARLSELVAVVLLIACDYLIFRQGTLVDRLQRSRTAGMQPIDSLRQAFFSDASDIHLTNFKKEAGSLRFTFGYKTSFCIPTGKGNRIEMTEESKDILLKGVKKDHFIPESHRQITEARFKITRPFWSKYYRVHWAVPGVGQGIAVTADVLA